MTTPVAPPPARPQVLLVDDERDLLESLREALEVEFALDLAASAGEAGRMMEARHYQVVVSDHLMPGETGLDFLIRVQTRHPRTRRILLTGYTNSELISRSVTLAGLSACLVKPLHAAQIAEAIRRALAPGQPISG